MPLALLLVNHQLSKSHENSHPLDVKTDLLQYTLKTGKKCVLRREELGSIVGSVYICLVLLDFVESQSLLTVCFGYIQLLKKGCVLFISSLADKIAFKVNFRERYWNITGTLFKMSG